MKQRLLITFAFALLVSGTLHVPAQAKGVSGAIFTTDMYGAVVNGNQYASKCDVYLDGGPGPNAPAKAAGLPDGDYYFQVTDPSGQTLLSTDPVSNRQFHVTGGVIVTHTGTHPTGIDQDHWEDGAITIRLADQTCPADFLNTPNNGGVYKVWATPVADFVGDPTVVDNDCGNGCFHGFVPSKSKTDNFKANPSTPTFCLNVKKEFSDEFGDTTPRAGWMISITDPLGSTNTYHTGEDGFVEEVCGLAPGLYMVTEEVQEGTQILGLIVNDISVDPTMVDITYSFTWDPSKPEPVIIFINEETSTPPPIG